jgi:hypothetical protein
MKNKGVTTGKLFFFSCLLLTRFNHKVIICLLIYVFLEYYFANRKLISISIFKTVQLYYFYIMTVNQQDYPHYTIHAPKLQYEMIRTNLLILLFKPLTSSFTSS